MCGFGRSASVGKRENSKIQTSHFHRCRCQRSLKNLDNLDIGGIPAECQIWDIDRVFRVCCSDLGRQNIEIDFREYIPEGIPCLEASKPLTAEYNSYLCIIPGKVLADIYDKYGSQLLEGNVRSFLFYKGRRK